jgi:phage protein D
MSEYQVLLNGSPVDQEFYDLVTRLEVEENADLPDAVSFQLPVAAKDGQLTWVGDRRIGPYANVAVVVTPDDGDQQCLFDGYVLSHKVRVPTGPTAATVDVWGQDASVLMGLTETVKEWSGVSDTDVAAQIFRSYGARPAAENSRESAPAHTEEGHTLMQRGSDLDFLRSLARRTGRWFRVACEQKPGDRVGWFAAPSLSGTPALTIDVNTIDGHSVPVLDFSWDASRPTAVAARQASLTDPDEDGVSADTSDSGLPALASRALAAFAGKDRTTLLTAAADAAELPQRAAGLLREAGWFARCEGTADVAMLDAVPRVGMIAEVVGCGAMYSGKYLVWSVRHTITRQSHQAALVLVRNAVGEAR